MPNEPTKQPTFHPGNSTNSLIPASNTGPSELKKLVIKIIFKFRHAGLAMETRNPSNGTVGCECSMPPGSICSVQKPHSTILTSNTAAKPVVSSRQVSQIGETYAYFQLQAANQPYMCLPPCTGSHGATVHSPGMAKVSNYWECYPTKNLPDTPSPPCHNKVYIKTTSPQPLAYQPNLSPKSNRKHRLSHRLSPNQVQI